MEISLTTTPMLRRLCHRCWVVLPRRAFSTATETKTYTPKYRSFNPPRQQPPHVHRKPHITQPSIGTEQLIPYFEGHVSEWASSAGVQRRIHSFGVSSEHAKTLLAAFVETVEAGGLSDTASIREYHLGRLLKPHDMTSIDSIYSTTFFSWVVRTSSSLEELGVPKHTLQLISSLVEASTRTFPADEFPNARAMHRKIIMHVGPTNSGKTHHALRALAAAKSGVYAGPLRLLAHEIWERLNTGQIVPLGLEQPPPSSELAKTMARGNPAYARQCNMLTGEERKVVGEHVKLLSCTIEMVSFTRQVDVGVIDEIQMIGDPDRGAAWTSALLGLCANEIHLCGEETAVPLVEELLKDTGDSLEVRRYQRLTPLHADETSLEGDWSRVRKGDCIVTFRRSSIFDIKKQVEDMTGLRCAVAYGRLPPEVRSEQAALFNDPDSGYDVLIGSDAVGMGLNLKINRVIFHTLSKYTGQTVLPLSVSAVKQIAGRAGRYGQSDNDLGGSATTFLQSDIPYLQHCLAQPFQSLPLARVGPSRESFEKIVQVLPSESTSMRTLLDAHMYVGTCGGGVGSGVAPALEAGEKIIDMAGCSVRFRNPDAVQDVCRYLDSLQLTDDTFPPSPNESSLILPLFDRVQLLYAPIPWRDPDAVRMIKQLLFLEQRYGRVWFEDIVEQWAYPLRRFERASAVMKELGEGNNLEIENLPDFTTNRFPPSFRRPDRTPEQTLATFLPLLPDTLTTLECFHKVLVFYLWMSFRHPVVYASYLEATAIKTGVEEVLNWCLNKIGEQGIDAGGPKLDWGNAPRVRPPQRRTFDSHGRIEGRENWSDRNGDRDQHQRLGLDANTRPRKTSAVVRTKNDIGVVDRSFYRARFRTSNESVERATPPIQESS